MLQYDDVVRQQRDLIYAQRDLIISQTDLYPVIVRMIKSVVSDLVEFPQFFRNDGSMDLDKMVATINHVWFQLVDFKFHVNQLVDFSKEELIEQISKDAVEVYDVLRSRIIDNVNEESAHQMEREILLMTFDQNWQLHIDQMTKLRSSSSLAHYAQKNPYQVYVERGTELFRDLLKRISHNVVRILMQNRYAQQKVNTREAQISALLKKMESKADVKDTKNSK
ncbi:hypothetical protein [Mycoplasma sp. ATU-Cv-508]|uniref:hypothetical protein n=1 Tax=Mycoplasma sp. ATU-Cv-508 TaxID=2048001 RepID=UPI000FDEC48F